MTKRFKATYIEETIIKIFMILSTLLIVGSLAAILIAIIVRGLPGLNLAMITQIPKGGYYLGKEGGILNAIIGSIYLAGGGTLLALVFGLPIAMGLNIYASNFQGQNTRWSKIARLALDVMWGIPSIVYGAFGFTLMVFLKMRASLLAGIIVLAILELPILTRAIDEFIRMIPLELEDAALSLGATRLEVAVTVLFRQLLPGLATAVLLAFGRGIGDAASVLFTTGYTDRIPVSIFDPAASLPLAVFFQLGTPYPEVQQRAYTAALVLTIIVFLTSLASRRLSRRFGRFAVK